jgi:ABC-2 type transport system ATP-binding protein
MLQQVAGDEVRVDGATHQVSVTVDGSGVELISALRAVEDIEVEDVALRQPRLDEVFLALTGRSGAGDALETAAS